MYRDICIYVLIVFVDVVVVFDVTFYNMYCDDCNIHINTSFEFQKQKQNLRPTGKLND